MRLDVLAEPLMSHIRERFLAPERVACLVDKVNARTDARPRRANADAERASVVAEVSRAEAEQARLVEALARVFVRIMRPLDGSWKAGWTLEMHGRPWVDILQGRSRQQLVAGARSQATAKAWKSRRWTSMREASDVALLRDHGCFSG